MAETPSLPPVPVPWGIQVTRDAQGVELRIDWSTDAGPGRLALRLERKEARDLVRALAAAGGDAFERTFDPTMHEGGARGH